MTSTPPSPDEQALLTRSVTDNLRQLAGDVLREPSRPTSPYGAPNIGTDWRNAWDDTQIHANRGSGEA